MPPTRWLQDHWIGSMMKNSVGGVWSTLSQMYSCIPSKLSNTIYGSKVRSFISEYYLSPLNESFRILVVFAAKVNRVHERSLLRSSPFRELRVLICLFLRAARPADNAGRLADHLGLLPFRHRLGPRRHVVISHERCPPRLRSVQRPRVELQIRGVVVLAHRHRWRRRPPPRTVRRSIVVEIVVAKHLSVGRRVPTHHRLADRPRGGGIGRSGSILQIYVSRVGLLCRRVSSHRLHLLPRRHERANSVPLGRLLAAVTIEHVLMVGRSKLRKQTENWEAVRNMCVIWSIVHVSSTSTK